MKLWMSLPLVALVLALGSPAQAGDFDGSKALICAPVEVNGCHTGNRCEKGIPDEFGAPSFLRLDFAKKQIVGPKRITPIRFQELDKELNQLILQGTELGNAWTIAISGEDGKMVLTFSDSLQAFVIFGSCTTL